MRHANRCLTSCPAAGGGFLCAFVLWLTVGLPAMAAEPVLKSIMPSGARPGDTVEVQLQGDGLQNAAQLHFSQSAIRAEHIAENRFRVTVAEDAAPGPIDVRVVTPDGLSAPRRFLVDTLPWSVEEEQNDSREAAQELSLPCLLDGRLHRSADVDWYRFLGDAGQLITIHCRSASLDGSVEPAFRLLEPSGKQLASSPAYSPEPFVHVTLPVTGEYTLRICDRAYQQDDFSFYRLRIAEGPYVVGAFPHVVNPSSSQDIALIGFGLGERWMAGCAQDFALRAERLEAPAHGDAAGGDPPTAAAALLPGFLYRSPAAPAGVRLGLVQEPLLVEADGGSADRANAPSLRLPSAVAGRLLEPNETDWYRFSAKKDETLEIDVYGERLGQRMDLEAAVHDAQDKLLATLPDKPAVKGMPAPLTLESLDPSGTWKAPADGEYSLAVRDLYGGSLYGPDRRYTLRIGPPRPGFDLALLPAEAKPHGISVARGGETKVQLVAVREGGFEGPITVRAEQLPPGVTWQAQPLEGKQVSLAATLAAAKDAQLGVHPLRLVAEAKIGDETVAQPVIGLTVVRPATPPAVRRTDEILLLVREP